MSVPDNSLSLRMAYACEAAYQISPAGSFVIPENRAHYDGIGFIQDPIVVLSKNGIVGAIVGQCSDCVIVAIRGTLPLTLGTWSELRESILDWMGDGDADLVPTDNIGLSVMVHSGFLEEFMEIRDGINASLSALRPIAKSLYFTGHSKGGAIASIAALSIDMDYYSDSETFYSASVITFASAMPGNEAFADEAHFMDIDSYRIEFADDLVPHLPAGRLLLMAMSDFDGHFISMKSCDYKPCGKLIYLTRDDKIIYGDSELLSTSRTLSLIRDGLHIRIGEIATDHSLSRSYIPALEKINARKAFDCDGGSATER